ncbi:MAG: delta-60 repeat domain-containing protein [Verrucomicrobiota bacterium]
MVTQTFNLLPILKLSIYLAFTQVLFSEFKPTITNTLGNEGVTTAVVQPDGKVIAGGVFDSAEGVARNNLARFYQHGTLDSTFNPNVNGEVEQIVLQDDGKIIIAGNFSSVGGSSKSYLARLNEDGGIDPNFSTVVNGKVNAVSLQIDGKILIGGHFTSVNSTTRNYLARLYRFSKRLSEKGLYIH